MTGAAIHVCGLARLDEVATTTRPSHMVSLIDPATPIARPEHLAPERHLRLDMHDIAAARPGHTPPGRGHVARLLEFFQSWEADAPMLIHCWMGVSRSTAAAYGLLCARNPVGEEAALAHYLRWRAPHAQPNPLIVAHVDELLDRNGAMTAAIAGLGRGDMETMGAPVALDLAGHGGATP